MFLVFPSQLLKKPYNRYSVQSKQKQEHCQENNLQLWPETFNMSEQLCGEDSIMRLCVVNVNLSLLFCSSKFNIYSVHVLLTVLFSYTCTVIQVRSIPEAVSFVQLATVHRLCFWADQRALAYLVTRWTS